MNVIVHKKKKTNDGKIQFPGMHCWNPVTEVVTIAAQVGGNRVSCKVDYSDIARCFEELSETPMETVKRYRVQLENAARELIENKTYEKDGSIKIGVTELQQV